MYAAAKTKKSPDKNFDSMLVMLATINLMILTTIFILQIMYKVANGENIIILSSNETEKKNEAITSQTRLARNSVIKLENRIHNVKSARLIRDPL